MKPDTYQYFYCPGCQKYRHRNLENLVVVAHLTEQKKRQENTDAMYTQHYALLCDECVIDAEKEFTVKGKNNVERPFVKPKDRKEARE